MFKKLSNLLFEEDDEEFVEEIEEEEAPVQPVVKKPAPQEAAPVQEKPMQRIDVTQPIPTVETRKEEPAFPPVQNESVFKQPAVQHASPRPIEPAPEAPKPSLGLTVDDIAEKKPAQPARPAAQKPQRKTNVYEFQPVISPMFGVDEKDLNAMQNSGKANRPGNEKKAGRSQIISPMYGVNEDARPSTVQTTVERSNRMEEMAHSRERSAAEDRIPEFSLDDILSTRDREYAAESANTARMPSLFDTDEIIDETVVIDKNHFDD